MMKLIRVLTVLGSLAAAGAHAHTPLASSSPADGGSMTAPVQEVVLTFGGDVRLTAVALSDAAGAQKALADLPTAVAAKFNVAVKDALAPGAYVVAWRAVGGDTHIISGEIHFTIVAAPSH